MRHALRNPEVSYLYPLFKVWRPRQTLNKKKVPRTLSPLQGLTTLANRAVKRPKIEEFRPLTNLVTEKW